MVDCVLGQNSQEGIVAWAFTNTCSVKHLYLILPTREKTLASEKEKMFLKKALALVTEILVVVNFYPHTYHKLKQKFIFL